MIWRALRRLFEAIGVVVVLFAGLALAYNQFVHYQSRLEGWPPRSAFIPAKSWSPDNPDKIRILSIDGGGMHGLVSLQILQHLEESSGRPIAEMFDFVAGTSTGAIIGALLLVPDENGKPKHSAEEVIEIYVKLSKGIFTVPLYHRIFTLDGVLGPRFLNHVKFIDSTDVFRGYRFGELLRPMMVPTYSREKSGLHLFNNLKKPDANLSLGPLIAAATSVPGIFPGVWLLGHEDYEGMYNDGAMIMNAPAHRAFEYALKRDPNAEFIVVLVGTNMTIVVPPEMDASGGMADWLIPLLTMAFKAQFEVASWSLETLEDIGSVVNIKAYTLNAPLRGGGGAFNTSKANIDHLRKVGQDYVAKNPQEVTDALKAVTGSAGERINGPQ